jgi:hypothetical protein
MRPATGSVASADDGRGQAVVMRRRPARVPAPRSSFAGFRYRTKTPRRPVNWIFNPDRDHGMITGRAVSTAIFDLCHGVQLAAVVRPRRRHQGHRDPHPAPRSLDAAPSSQQTSTPMARPSDPHAEPGREATALVRGMAVHRLARFQWSRVRPQRFKAGSGDGRSRTRSQQTRPVALQNDFTGPDLVTSARSPDRHDQPRACADALPDHYPHLRVAGAAGAILCRQRHRDIDLASGGGGAAPSDHHTPPRLARSGTACCPCPAATPCTAVSSDRLPPHPAGLAPAPGDEKVDSAAVPTTPCRVPKVRHMF